MTADDAKIIDFLHWVLQQRRVHVTKCSYPAWDVLYDPEQFIVTYGDDDSVGKELLRRYYAKRKN